MQDANLPANAPAILASDAERDTAVARLRDAVGEGRLSLDDFSQRIEYALSARTRSDLAAVLADLPTARELAPPGPGPATHQLIAIMGSETKTGRWRVGHTIDLLAVMGETKVDLRQAYIDGPVVTINAVSIMGNVEVWVPEGVEVEMDGFSIMGSRDVKLAKAVAAGPDAPVVRVHGFALMGSITVKTKQPFRWPWEKGPDDQRGLPSSTQ
jgi:hypothetical protein